MSINLALNNAVSGLNAAQNAIQVISTNVANTNTEGYSRKTTEQETRIVAGVGNGVDIAAVRRQVDLFLQRTRNEELASLGQLEVLDTYFGRMQELFGTPDSNQSIAAFIGEFGNALEALSVDPDKAAPQLEVVEIGDKIARRIQELTTRIQDARFEVDQEISRLMDVINDQLENISNLNRDITPLVRSGEPAGDLQDERDRALKTIAELIDVRTFTRDDGELVVFTAGGKVLVDGDASTLSHDPIAFADPAITYDSADPISGGVKGIFVNDATVATNDITTDITTGRLKGLIDTRDTNLVNLQSQLEQLTQFLVREVNLLHNTGTGYPPAQTLTGSNNSFTAPTTDTLTAGGSGYGTVILAATDETGVVDGSELSLDLDNLRTQLEAEGIIATAGGPLTVDHIVDAINGEFATGGAQALTTGTPVDGLPQVVSLATGNLSGNFAAVQNDSLVLSVADGFGIAINESTSAINDGTADRGFSYFFGLNDFFEVSPDNASNTAGTVTVRSTLISQPSEVSRGQLKLDSDGSTYVVTQGDDTTIRLLADKFDEQLSFASTGGLAAQNTTIESYAVAIISANANRADLTADQAAFQEVLTDDLENRVASVSGVNIDEELANMLVFQQAYSASARVIQTAQQLFDVLSSLIR